MNSEPRESVPFFSLSTENENKLKTSIFFIEATFFEQFFLWKDYHEKVDWIEDNIGILQEIGNLGKNKPVVVEFIFAKIYGKRICFYSVTSRYSDSVMVEEFIEKNYPVKWDKGNRRAMTNATNFHLAIEACKTANLKQWERKKKLEIINQI